MVSPPFDWHALVEEDQAPPEQILANALEFYTAIPAPARAAALDALRSPDPGAHAALVREIMRTVIAFQLQTRRADLIRNANGGVMPPEEPIDLDEDEQLGQEAVRLVKESREYRAKLRRGR